ncbi:MAG: GTPase [Thermoanaerobaculia bacterium]|jgi:predicted GTPase|nr:GTPase [Thermoanaerobaculia bacterium]
MRRRRVLILGAAGRDFHNFNVLFRDREEFEVLGFTAAQIPDIAGRTYPAVLAGGLYPKGIPIVAEQELESLVAAEKIDEAWFSYSDLAHVDVMHLASRSIAAGAHFVLAAAQKTMLTSVKPVVAITAVRTGVGKSQTTRYVSKILKAMGKKVVAVRHPMPYGDLSEQICQRFATYADLDKHKCTIEEREEYEPHIDNGFVVYAGVDYEKILRAAEEEADVILWDGGNNDTSFYTPALQITLVDPHRPGHEATYHPGEVNVLLADLILVNKVNTADPAKVAEVEATCRKLNPRATILRCNSEIRVSDPAAIRGKRVLVVEDGPTLTHGGMSYGAGWYAAHDAGAAEIVDPSPYAVGSLAATYAKYPNAKGILPAMGYGDEQIRDLEATIRATPADVVVEGTPIELARVLKTDKPIVNVTYELVEREPGTIERALKAAIG